MPHPDVTHFERLALWSINERLAGRAGLDLPEPDEEWLEDLEAWEMLRREMG